MSPKLKASVKLTAVAFTLIVTVLDLLPYSVGAVRDYLAAVAAPETTEE